MLKVHKFHLQVRDADPRVRLPAGAQLLHVAVQNSEVFVWALVDPDADVTYFQRFAVVGTGHAVPPDTGRYIGTVHLMGGDLVLHIFEAAA